MTRTIKNTAVAFALVSGVFATAASAGITDKIKADLETRGYSADVINQLSKAELHAIENVQLGEGATDAAQAVDALVDSFTN